MTGHALRADSGAVATDPRGRRQAHTYQPFGRVRAAATDKARRKEAA